MTRAQSSVSSTPQPQAHVDADSPPPVLVYRIQSRSRMFTLLVPSRDATAISLTCHESVIYVMSKARVLPQLSSSEVTLLDLAADDPRDNVSFSDKEAAIIQLYHQIQELELEKAFLEQELEPISANNDAEQLAAAERELLEARATYTVRKKAVNTVLITDPILKAIHLKGATPAERALLRLVNRRDVLSLAQENLTEAQTSTMKKLSTLEVENLKLHKQNQKLARELLNLTKDDDSWREQLDDLEIKEQLTQLEAEHRRSKAKWETMKSVASAIVVGSGVNWAEDEDLTALVLDESDD